MISKRLIPFLASTTTTTTAYCFNSMPVSRRLLFLQSSIVIGMPSVMRTVQGAAAAMFSTGQERLVQNLKEEGVVKQREAVEVLKQVDRQNYIDYSPYSDSPKGIECGQTISAPHMHGFALDEMVPILRTNGQHHELKLLDVGCGSGYLTAAMGRLIKPKTTTKNEERENEDDEQQKSILGVSGGKVYGMDVHERLVTLTRNNIMKEDGDLLDSGTITLKHGNGWEGWPDKDAGHKFDVIHVGAAADEFPSKLANQLVKGGIMVIPIGPTNWIQYFYRVIRVDETGNPDKDFQKTRLMGVRYVPLVH